MAQQQWAEIRWSVVDPQNREIALKQSTYEEHIDNDHEAKDAEYRMKLENAARQVLTAPRFIIKDKSGNGNIDYLDIVAVPAENQKTTLKLLKVVVSISSGLHEVATWIAQRRISEGELDEGGILYDRDAKAGISDQQV